MSISTPNINQDPLSNLDSNKLSLLNSDQINKLKSLSPDQIKSLNNLSIGQWKDLSTDQLKKLSNNPVKDAKSQANSQISKARGKYREVLDNIRNSKNPKDFLKRQFNKTPKDIGNSLFNALQPQLMKFIQSEQAANLLINKLIKDTKKQIEDKGRVDVVNGAITFVPRDKGNYQVFKDNFDRKVSSLKKVIRSLKSTVDSISSILKLIKKALPVYQKYLALKKKKSEAKAVSAQAQLNVPQISYPNAGDYIRSKEFSEKKNKEIEEKITHYQNIINYIESILDIYNNIINNLEIKLNQLSFTITSSPYSNDLSSSLPTFSNTSPSETEYANEITGKEYTIKLVTTLSGAQQAIAYDKFSMMKITQTAPSKTRSGDELINELKQILG